MKDCQRSTKTCLEFGRQKNSSSTSASIKRREPGEKQKVARLEQSERLATETERPETSHQMTNKDTKISMLCNLDSSLW